MTVEPVGHFEALWDLMHPEKVAATPTSYIYKVHYQNHPAILKIYTDLGRNCESDAPYFFEPCSGHNVPRIFQFNDDAMLMEYINGPVLKEWIIQRKDEEATRIIGKTLSQLHSVPQKFTYNFETLETRFKALFAHAKRDVPDILKRAASFARTLLKNQKEIKLLHGDMHHDNVMQNNSLWLAIDPQPLIGDRAYDCANTLHNPHQMPELTEDKERLLKQSQILGDIMMIDPQRIIDYAFVHGCLSACWSYDDDGESFSENLSLRTSAILEPYVNIR